MRRPLSTVLLLAGCALGYRGEAELLGEHDLRDTTELRVELPDTPLSVEACAAERFGPSYTDGPRALGNSILVPSTTGVARVDVYIPVGATELFARLKVEL